VQVRSTIQGNPGAIYFVTGDEGILWRENTSTRNFPVKFERADGVTEITKYVRSNLTKIFYRKGLPDQTYVQASYRHRARLRRARPAIRPTGCATRAAM